MLPATAADADLPSYKPPPRGAPSGRAGAGTRGIVPPPRIWAFAPDHIGLTTREQPSLYWYAAKSETARVELVAVGAQGVKVLLGENVAAPASPRVMSIDLARYGIRLQPGIEYRWTVALESEPRQGSNSAGIERIAPSPELTTRLEATPRTRRPAVYAEEGIWYDAIGSLGELIEQSPADTSLRMHRAALLEQIGLKAAAAADIQR
jgi:hypothetical protein